MYEVIIAVSILTAVGLLAAILENVWRVRHHEDITTHFVPCAGDCGRSVMLVGREPEFGRCEFCTTCWLKIDNAPRT
jgi:hypothetical protein